MKRDYRNKAVFLITIDALRADHLKSYGYHRNTAPNLEKFAEKGTTFLNTITNGPETPSAFSAIFTSILPFLDGGYSPLPLQKITLPQLLKEYGISNICIHSNPNLGRFFNYARGFDVFLDGERYKTQQSLHKSLGIRQVLSFYIKKVLDYKDLSEKLMYRLKGFNKIKVWLRKRIPFLTDILLPFTPIAYNAPYVSTKVISLLKKYKKPFFLWAHFMDAHSPYNPPTRNVIPFRKTDFSISERDLLINRIRSNPHNFEITKDILDDLMILYDGEINFIDEFLAKLLEYINLQYKTDCLIIITADHGESFYEHGSFGHQGSIFEELLKVPLFMREMGKKQHVRIINNTVELIDIAPTILDYFGLNIPETFQGTSLLPLIRGELFKQKKIVISECYQKNGKMKRNKDTGFILLAIRKQEWKYIFDEEKKTELLFNIDEDPQEKNNLIEKNFEKLAEFHVIRDYHLNKTNRLFEETSKIVKAIDRNKLI